MCFPRITKVLSVSRRRRNKAKQEEKKSKAVDWIEQSTDRVRNQQTNQSTERHVGSHGRWTLLSRYYLPVVEKGAKIGVFCLRGDRRQQIPKRTLAGREYDEAV